MGKVKSYYFDNGDVCPHGNDWHANCSECDFDESVNIPNGWDVDVDENGPFIVTDDVSTEIDLGRDVPDEIWEPEYLGDK